MRKLLNISLGILTILIIALLTFPLVMSFWLKNHYQSLLNRINTSHDISLKVLTFDRGWFSSNATIRITIAGAAHRKPVQFLVDQRIKNGPIVIGKVKGGAPSIWLAKAWIHSQSNNSHFKLTSSTLIRWNNTVDDWFNATRITIANKQQQLVVNNLQSHLVFSLKNHRLNAKTTIATANLSEKQNPVATRKDYQTKLSLKNISFQSNSQQSAPLWFGGRDLQIGTITYITSQHQSLQLNHITLHERQSQKNGMTSATIKAHIDRFGAHQSKIKPLLKPIDIKLTFSGVDTKALADLAHTASALKHSTQLNKRQKHTLYLASTQVMNKGLAVTLNYVRIGTPDGVANFTAQLTLPLQPNAVDVISLLEGAHATLHATAPTTWLITQLANLYQGKAIKINNEVLKPADVAKQQVHSWIADKTLIQDGPSVKVNLLFENGKLLINGLPLFYQAPPISIAKNISATAALPGRISPTAKKKK